MTRVEHDIEWCYVKDEDGGEYFDWDAFQYLCDCAEYWDTQD